MEIEVTETLEIRSIMFYTMKRIFQKKYSNRPLTEFFKLFNISNSNPYWKYNGQIYGKYHTMSTHEISEMLEKEAGIPREIAYFQKFIDVGVNNSDLKKYADIKIKSGSKTGTGKPDIKDKAEKIFADSIEMKIDEYIDKETGEKKVNINNNVYKLYIFFNEKKTPDVERAEKMINDIVVFSEEYKKNRKVLLNYRGNAEKALLGIQTIMKDLEAINTIFKIRND